MGVRKNFALNGAGIAFFGSYVFHGLLTYPIARILSGFRWSAANWRTGGVFLSLIATVCCSLYVLPPVAAVSIGTLALIGSCLYSVRVLVRLVPFVHLPRPLQRMVAALAFEAVVSRQYDSDSILRMRVHLVRSSRRTSYARYEWNPIKT